MLSTLCDDPRGALRPEQCVQLVELLLEGPHFYGYQIDYWTTQRIIEITKRYFGVILSETTTARMMTDLGWRFLRSERNNPLPTAPNPTERVRGWVPSTPTWAIAV